jgi:hypothetical protein
MSTTASPVSPSYVIPHTVTTGSNPSLDAMQAGAARNAHQHALAMVSKGKVGGGGGGKNKNKNKKKSKKYSRKSAMKKRFSKKFRRSILRRKSRKMSLHKKNKKALALRGGATINNGDKLTIPSFRQANPAGSGIINQLAGNHAQTLAYSAYDGAVKPVS